MSRSVATSTPHHHHPRPGDASPKDLSRRGRMARKLRTKKGRAHYGRRKVIVEPVFGQIKRGLGFTQFLLNGREKIRGEWALICMAHNLKKLHAAT